MLLFVDPTSTHAPQVQGLAQQCTRGRDKHAEPDEEKQELRKTDVLGDELENEESEAHKEAKSGRKCDHLGAGGKWETKSKPVGEIGPEKEAHEPHERGSKCGRHHREGDGVAAECGKGNEPEDRGAAGEEAHGGRGGEPGEAAGKKRGIGGFRPPHGRKAGNLHVDEHRGGQKHQQAREQVAAVVVGELGHLQGHPGRELGDFCILVRVEPHRVHPLHRSGLVLGQKHKVADVEALVPLMGLGHAQRVHGCHDNLETVVGHPPVEDVEPVRVEEHRPVVPVDESERHVVREEETRVLVLLEVVRRDREVHGLRIQEKRVSVAFPDERVDKTRLTR